MHQKHGIPRIYTQKPMNENKHFSGISSEKPPKRLFRTIIERLKIEKLLKTFKERFWIFFSAFIGSAILIVMALLMLNSELKESESVPFLSLIFSDTFSVITYFKYFILAILESIPVVSLTASLSAVVLAMILLRFTVKYREKILTINKLKK